MNRQKLEHLLETLEMVRRYQVEQNEEVRLELKKLQERYREETGHYYHFNTEPLLSKTGRELMTLFDDRDNIPFTADMNQETGE